MFADKNDAGRPVIRVDRGLLPLRSPTGFHGLRHHAKARHGFIAETVGQQISSPQKGQFAVIKQVSIEVADTHASGAGAHEAVQWLLEKSDLSGKADLVGQVASYRAFAGLRVVRLANP